MAQGISTKSTSAVGSLTTSEHQANQFAHTCERERCRDVAVAAAGRQAGNAEHVRPLKLRVLSGQRRIRDVSPASWDVRGSILRRQRPNASKPSRHAQSFICQSVMLWSCSALTARGSAGRHTPVLPGGWAAAVCLLPWLGCRQRQPLTAAAAGAAARRTPRLSCMHHSRPRAHSWQLRRPATITDVSRCSSPLRCKVTSQNNVPRSAEASTLWQSPGSA